MFDGAKSHYAVFAAAGFFGGLCAIYILDFAAIRADWCAGVQTECLRAWIGALSGWAAALFAGATIMVLLRQVKVSRRVFGYQRQLDLQRQYNGTLAALNFASLCQRQAIDILAVMDANPHLVPSDWAVEFQELFERTSREASYNVQLMLASLHAAVKEYKTTYRTGLKSPSPGRVREMKRPVAQIQERAETVIRECKSDLKHLRAGIKDAAEY